LQANIDSFRQTYPDAQYRLYDNADLRSFIEDRFGGRILGVYDRLIPYAFKADLARYCLLYELGDVYSDLSHRHYHPIWTADTKVSVFRDLTEHPPWAVSNGLIASVAKRPEFKQVIEAIARHADAEYYGQASLEVTGPYLLGAILAQSADWRSIHFGHSKRVRGYLPFGKQGIRVRKYMADGTLVVDKVKRAASCIDEFSTGQGNSYNQLWLARQVWRT